MEGTDGVSGGKRKADTEECFTEASLEKDGDTDDVKACIGVGLLNEGKIV